MAKLQACAKCGAQFDVAAMAAGQRFTCGACGAVVTVGGAGGTAPVRVPPAPVAIGAAGVPSRAVPAPAKAGARGPQFVPPDRQTTSVKSSSSRDRAEDRDARKDRGARDRRSRDGAPTKKGLSPAAMAGIGGGILAIALGGLLLTRKPDTKPAGGGGGTNVAGLPTPDPTGMNGGGAGMGSGMDAGMDAAMGEEPPAGTDTLASLESAWKELKHPTPPQYREYLKRFKNVSGGKDRAKSIATELLAQVDPNDKDAHELLGHKEFKEDVPEEISFRKPYPFVRAVEEAHAQRWFDDDEAYALAMKAYERTLVHAKRLATDREYQALDVARRGIDRDEHFKNYNYAAIFASPYLICYSTEERIDEEAYIKLKKAERAKMLAELEKKKEGYMRVLAEKAKIFPQLYAEFMKRYAEDCDLHPLMDEFGGRPDYPAGKKTFREGCPMIVWIFSDKKAFNEYHEYTKNPIPSNVAGYFSPGTGWVYLYDEEGSDREFEVNKNVHEGTHQLEHWFQRQKNEWAHPVVPQSFFGEGFAEYMGSVLMAKDRTLTFTGINRPRLESLKGIKKQWSDQNKVMKLFPLKELTGFEGYGNVQAWGVQNWGLNPGFVLGFFYIQSWAFVYFLNEFENHKYQAKFNKYLDDMLNHPTRESSGYASEKFKREFGMNTDDDWKKMQKEFEGFVDKLLKMDSDKLGGKPPARDDWPGYVPPDVDLGDTKK